MENKYRSIDNGSQIALDAIWNELVQQCIFNNISTGRTFDSNSDTYDTTSTTDTVDTTYTYF